MNKRNTDATRPRKTRRQATRCSVCGATVNALGRAPNGTLHPGKACSVPTTVLALPTPGPWTVKNFTHIYGPDGIGVAAAERTAFPVSVANARLIAAAPKLLGALQDLVNEVNAYADSDDYDLPDTSLAERIIAEASGEAKPPAVSICDDCGIGVDEIIGCPDGAEICQACFDGGAH